jgi:threonine aldolase
VALDDFEAGRLLADHARIRTFAQQAAAMTGFHVDLDTVQTNICIVHLTAECVAQWSFFTVEYVVDALTGMGLHILARDGTSLRIVTHRDITDSCIEALVKGFQDVSNALV